MTIHANLLYIYTTITSTREMCNIDILLNMSAGGSVGLDAGSRKNTKVKHHWLRSVNGRVTTYSLYCVTRRPCIRGMCTLIS